MTSTRANSASAPATTIADLLARDAEAVLEVLEEFGIRLDPWTLIAVACTPEQLAEYSAILRPTDLREALEHRLMTRAATPVSPADVDEARRQSAEEWLRNTAELAERIGSGWTSPKTGLQILEEMRQERYDALGAAPERRRRRKPAEP